MINLSVGGKILTENGVKVTRKLESVEVRILETFRACSRSMDHSSEREILSEQDHFSLWSPDRIARTTLEQVKSTQ